MDSFVFLRYAVATSEVVITNIEQKIPNDLQRVGKNQHLEPTQTPSPTVTVSSGSRPSSNYNNRSQVIGPQKGMYLYNSILKACMFFDAVQLYCVLVAKLSI